MQELPLGSRHSAGCWTYSELWCNELVVSFRSCFILYFFLEAQNLFFWFPQMHNLSQKVRLPSAWRTSHFFMRKMYLFSPPLSPTTVLSTCCPTWFRIPAPWFKYRGLILFSLTLKLFQHYFLHSGKSRESSLFCQESFFSTQSQPTYSSSFGLEKKIKSIPLIVFFCIDYMLK